MVTIWQSTYGVYEMIICREYLQREHVYERNTYCVNMMTIRAKYLQCEHDDTTSPPVDREMSIWALVKAHGLYYCHPIQQLSFQILISSPPPSHLQPLTSLPYPAPFSLSDRERERERENMFVYVHLRKMCVIQTWTCMEFCYPHETGQMARIQ